MWRSSLSSACMSSILQECCKKDKRSAPKRWNRDTLRRYSGASPAPHHKEPTMNASLPAAVTSAATTWENPMGTDGFEFIEYAAPDPPAMGALFERMGFKPIAKHRHKAVTLYRQGEINFIINAEPDRFAHPLRGPPRPDLHRPPHTQRAPRPHGRMGRVLRAPVQLPRSALLRHRGPGHGCEKQGHDQPLRQDPHSDQRRRQRKNQPD